MKEKISKLVNVYKKYGFIGFCKKLYAYVVANYLDRISFAVLFQPAASATMCPCSSGLSTSPGIWSETAHW